MWHTFRRNSGGVPPGKRATIFIACSHWLKSDVAFSDVIDILIVLLLKLLLRECDLDDDGVDTGVVRILELVEEFVAVVSGAVVAEDGINPNFMSSNWAEID